MSRLQSVLVVILGALAALVFVPIVWGLSAPLVAVVPVLLQAVPGWVWWVALGSLWWVPWAFGRRGCRRSSCSTATA